MTEPSLIGPMLDDLSRFIPWLFSVLPWWVWPLALACALFRYRKCLRLNKLRKWAWKRLTRNWGRRSAERTPIPPGVRFSIFQRDNFTCVYCGYGRDDGRKLHLDHYKPWWKVRTHDPANFVTACDQCNMGKSGRIMRRPIEDFVR